MNNLELRNDDGFDFLLRSGDSKTVRSRLNIFQRWCAEQRIHWMQANLAVYRDDLLDDKADTTVDAYLSTLRSRIQDTIRTNEFQDWLREHLYQDGDTFADLGAKLQMMTNRLENMVHAKNSSVKVVTEQDKADSQQLWLNGQESELMNILWERNPPILACRDAAIGQLLLDTGLRAAELCSLQVSDLQETYQGHPALRVRKGKGNKQRMIVYGDLTEGRDMALDWAQAWNLSIESPLFQGFSRSYNSLIGSPLTTRHIERILNIELSIGCVTPHALRRTYARKLYLSPYSMPVEAIQKQMGHSSRRVTESYIGDTGVELRVPRNLKNNISRRSNADTD